MNRLLKVFLKSFNKKSISSLEVLAHNENIDYEDLSQKICFSDEGNSRSHVIDFLKIFGPLYDLLKDLVTSKINITNKNANQMRFLVYSMMGYYDKDFFYFGNKNRRRKNYSWRDKALGMARIILRIAKINH